MITYISGFFILGWLPSLPTVWVWLLILLLCLLLGWWLSTTRTFLFLLFTGFSVAYLYGQQQLSHRLSESAAGIDWEIVGIVSGLPDQNASRARFDLTVEQITAFDRQEPAPSIRTIRLSWYQPAHPVRPGDHLRVTVRLKPPHSLRNPKGFDYEYWAFVRHIDAVGYVKQLSSEQSVGYFSFDRLRFDLISWVNQRFERWPKARVMLNALWLGDKSAIDADGWQLLQTTGTTHLMVVSGLHIGVIVGLGWWLGRLLTGVLWRGKEARISHFSLPFVCALLLSGVYVILAGFSIPTVRAWLMAAILLSGFLTFDRISIWRRWWGSMAVVLTLFPLAIHEVGFWLSFIAVAALIFLVDSSRGVSKLRMIFLSQWYIFLVIGPFSLLFFGVLSLFAPLINVLAIPLVSLALLISVPSIFLELLGIPWLLESIAYGLEGIWLGLEVVAKISSQGLWQRSSVDWIAVGFAIFGSVLLVIPLSYVVRLAGCLCWVPLLFKAPASLTEGDFQVVVFDVGQGLSVLVRTANHQLIYDTGPAYRHGGGAFERAVLPYLKHQGITGLDRLVISHDDNDHAGGWSVAHQHLAITQTEAGMPEQLPIESARYCESGLQWQWDGVNFRYLQPEASLASDDNNRSCILEVRSDQCSLLITGDADTDIEAQIAPNLRPVTWLIAGHHGSKTSTGAPLLNRVQPEVVVFSAGFLNPYRHPYEQVVERVKASGAAIYRTDRQGAILLNSSPNNTCLARGWREMEKRYWSGS